MIPAASPSASLSILVATRVSTTPLDIFPGGPAIGSTGVWYWDEQAGKVVRVDTTSGQVAATIPIGDPRKAPYGTPKTVATDGRLIWATDAAGNAVIRIDPKTNQIVDRIALAVPIAASGATVPVVPYGLAVDGAALWVSDFDQGIVVRLDPSSRSVTEVVKGIDHPEGIAVGFGSVWVVEHRTGVIVRIDRASASVAARITLPGTGDNPVCGMCVNNVTAGQDSIWVPLNLGRGVVRIDPATDAVSATIQLAGLADTVAEGDGVIWSAAWDGTIPCTDRAAFVARIDPDVNAVAGTFVVPCAVTVGFAAGDLWVGTADAPNGTTRLHIEQ